jgi:hypothetical protein
LQRAPREGTWPRRAGHPLEQEKEQNGRDRVQHDIREIMSACIEPKELAIKHVRNRRQRMPVPRVIMCERPNNSGQCEAV